MKIRVLAKTIVASLLVLSLAAPALAGGSTGANKQYKKQVKSSGSAASSSGAGIRDQSKKKLQDGSCLP